MTAFYRAYDHARNWAFERQPGAARMPATDIETALGAAIGKSEATIRRYVAGVRTPDWSVIIAFEALASGLLSDQDLMKIVKNHHDRWVLNLPGGTQRQYRGLKAHTKGGS